MKEVVKVTVKPEFVTSCFQCHYFEALMSDKIAIVKVEYCHHRKKVIQRPPNLIDKDCLLSDYEEGVCSLCGK